MKTMMQTEPVHMHVMESPVGQIELAFLGETVCALHFTEGRTSVWPVLARRFGPDVEVTQIAAHPAIDAMHAYFGGRLDALEEIAVDPEGTDFQQRVWRALREIPIGQTASYADIAARIGAPKAFRAVARANATNPIGIVIPCHRVIGSNGALTGYGGGIERKAWLLEHERAMLA